MDIRYLIPRAHQFVFATSVAQVGLPRGSLLKPWARTLMGTRLTALTQPTELFLSCQHAARNGIDVNLNRETKGEVVVKFLQVDAYSTWPRKAAVASPWQTRLLWADSPWWTLEHLLTRLSATSVRVKKGKWKTTTGIDKKKNVLIWISDLERERPLQSSYLHTARKTALQTGPPIFWN